MKNTLQRSLESPRILVFTATYNERDNIRALLEGIWACLPDAHLLIVDDHSPDGTGALLDELASLEPRLSVIHRPRKLGLGSAHYLAMIYAINHGYDLLVTMDADLSHDPQDIPKLIAPINHGADFVIGSRYVQGGSCDYEGYRKNLSVLGNKVARLLLQIPIHEFTTSFRVFRVAKLSQLNFNWIGNYGYSFFLETVFRLSQAGFQMKEVPIHFSNRNYGESKIPKLEIVRGMKKLSELTFARFIHFKSTQPSQLIADPCTHCGGHFLYEISSESLSPQINLSQNDSNVYKCSSMAHHQKPQVAKCLQCDLEQIPLSKRPANLGELYADVVDQQYLDHLAVKHKTFDRLLSQLSPYLPTTPGAILEIGSYCGLFLSKMAKRGWHCTGIEPSKWATGEARKNPNLTIINCGVESAESMLANQQFEVIVSWDVIEHVENPATMIAMVSRHLKPGGIFAFSTLDVDSWFARAMGKSWPWLMEMHLFYFTPKVLKEMLEEQGIELIRFGNYCHYASLQYIYQKACFALPSSIRQFLLWGQKLVPNWTIPVSLGDVKVFIGRKKDS